MDNKTPTPDDWALLEMAAKAAGYARMKYFDNVPYVSGEMNGDDFQAWNPLTDAGDRYRLAEKLGFVVDFNAGVISNARGDILAVSEIDIGRAIVRAAAQIAEQQNGGSNGS